jgi:hypothetical protein
VGVNVILNVASTIENSDKNIGIIKKKFNPKEKIEPDNK